MMDDCCRNCFWSHFEDGAFSCCYDWGCDENAEDLYFMYAPPLCCCSNYESRDIPDVNI